MRVKLEFQYFSDNGISSIIFDAVANTNSSIRSILARHLKQISREELLKDLNLINVRLNCGESESKNSAIEYLINEDGSVRFLDNMTQASHDWTLADIKQLKDLDYVVGDAKHIIISPPSGLGAGGIGESPIIDILLWVVDLYDTGVAMKRAIRYVEAYQTTKKWRSNGIHSIYQIEHFVRPNRIWTTDDITIALAINKKKAEKILISLGFEQHAEEWAYSDGAEATTQRKRWKNIEKRMFNRRK